MRWPNAWCLGALPVAMQPRIGGRGVILMHSSDGICFDCSACMARSCDKDSTHYPGLCPTVSCEAEVLDEVKQCYRENEKIVKMYQASAQLEGLYYGKLTRVEEIILFAKKIGVQKLGIAFCI